MKICVNGQWEELQGGVTLAAYLSGKNIPPQTVVVERNAAIPDRESWGSVALADGDVLEIVKFMGGG